MNETPAQPTLRFILSDLRYFIAFGFGSGLSPKAPGTVGTLVGFPLFMLFNSWLDTGPLLILIAVFLAVGIPICDAAGKAVGEADHKGIVWDEIAAFMLVLAYAPPTLFGFVLSFALFRLFDIWKPFPIGLIDSEYKNGYGVMADDFAAAVYSILMLLVLV